MTEEELKAVGAKYIKPPFQAENSYTLQVVNVIVDKPTESRYSPPPLTNAELYYMSTVFMVIVRETAVLIYQIPPELEAVEYQKELVAPVALFTVIAEATEVACS